MKRSRTEPRKPDASAAREPFEAALKADAARIRADIPAAVLQRIGAALARERPRAARPAPRDALVRPWLAGSLVGLAVAATIVLVVRLDGPPGEAPPRPVPEVPVADRSEPLEAFGSHVPLRAETADLTAPLEEELRNLQSDLEKARENVERDLRLTF